jgi:uncharacterized glyoxalase superfamily protein PhnB
MPNRIFGTHSLNSYWRVNLVYTGPAGSGVEDMAVQGVSIALSTEDVARSVKFYVEQLGFTCTLQLGGFARVRLGAADIMLAQPNAHLPWQGPRFTGSIYLDVDNVDELWESLKTRARIVYPIETMEYGVREFGLLDDNGYQLSFAQHVAAN